MMVALKSHAGLPLADASADAEESVEAQAEPRTRRATVDIHLFMIVSLSRVARSALCGQRKRTFPAGIVPSVRESVHRMNMWGRAQGGIHRAYESPLFRSWRL